MSSDFTDFQEINVYKGKGVWMEKCSNLQLTTRWDASNNKTRQNWLLPDFEYTQAKLSVFNVQNNSALNFPLSKLVEYIANFAEWFNLDGAFHLSSFNKTEGFSQIFSGPHNRTSNSDSFEYDLKDI